MPASIDKLFKILLIEAQQNKYQDRVIIGGLEKFTPSWTQEAQKDNVPPEIINSIKEEIDGYGQANKEARYAKIVNILNIAKTAYPDDQKLKKTETILLSNKPENPQTTEAEEQTPNINPVREAEPKMEQMQQSPSAQTSLPPKTGLGLKAPLTTIRGIGPETAKKYSRLGVKTLGDLFYYFPRRYDDYSKLKPINRLQYGDELTIIATVQSTLVTRMKIKGASRIEVVVSDGTGFLRLIFFRHGDEVTQYFENQFRHGAQMVISGKVDMYLGRLQMREPAWEVLDSVQLNTNGIIAVYPLTEGLTQKTIRKDILEVINFYGNKISDFLPMEIKRSANLMDLSVALHHIHRPKDMAMLASSRERLSFDEIFLMQLGVLQQKKTWQSGIAEKFTLSDNDLNSLIGCLPYTLTNAQQHALMDIRKDLESGIPMNRLIQGDVGSGKTIVAALSACIVAASGAQSALMAPTSILAEQHYSTMIKLAASFPEGTAIHPEEIRLLTGDTPKTEREELLQNLAEGKIKLLIGTHALLESPVQFNNLQFVIIDEQHRFGVAQRAALRQKGTTPHLLVMTATPIPRSLALTLYGDLDLSVMDEMPVGRIPVETHVIHPLERERAYQMISGQIQQGFQTFIIYPLIEKGDDDEAKAAVEEHDYLQREIFPKLKIGLLHGRMKPDEKESVMKQFRNKEFDILVSTTVVEVGVDIPNATIMLIEGANRFGLAQLHQLRGRVGRGGNKSYCLLIPDNEDALQNERLEVMTQTNDGFVLAEKDLQQRGPGDFIGSRQSGFVELKMASYTDLKTIEKARAYASDLFTKDPELSLPEHSPLAERLTEFWQSTSSDIS